MSESHGETAPDSRGRTPRRRSSLKLSEAITGCLLAATFAGLFADLWWPLDLLNHFRPHLLALLIVSSCVPSLAKRPAWAIWLIAGIAVNAAMILPVVVGRDTAQVEIEVNPLTILAFNVHTANERHADAIAYMAGTKADLILVQETNLSWIDDLRAGLTEYDMLLSRPRDDNFGIALLARRTSLDPEKGLSITSVQFVDPSGERARVPAIELMGRWCNRPLAFLGLHTLPPVHAQAAADRDAALRGAAQWARDHNNIACIIAGDLNATPWCLPLRRLVSESGLLNTMKGHWPVGTWHASLPAFLGLSIDHCLYSHSLVPLSREVGSDSCGSDHRPLLVRFAWTIDDWGMD